jgi:hypothetical protein
MTEATTKAAVLTKRERRGRGAGHPWIYRLLRAEADGIPGLVADRYGDYFVLQVGSAAVEVGSLPSSPFSKTSSLPPASFCAVIRLFGGARAWPGE